MKKVLAIKGFGDGHSRSELIVAFRRKQTLFLQNLEMTPSDRFHVKHDKDRGIVTIEIRLAEDEQLTIGEAPGMALKTQIEDK